MGHWLDRVRAAEALLRAERAALAEIDEDVADTVDVQQARDRVDAAEGVLVAMQGHLWASAEERSYDLLVTTPSGRATHMVVASSSTDARRHVARWARSIAQAYGLSTVRVLMEGEDGYVALFDVSLRGEED